MGRRRDSCVRLRGPKWISSLFCSSHSLWHVCWLSWSTGAKTQPSTASPAPTLTRHPLQLSRLLVQVCDEGFQLPQEILLSLVTWTWVSAHPHGLQPTLGGPASSGSFPPFYIHLPSRLCHLDLKLQYQIKDNNLAQLSQLGLLLLGLNLDWYKCDIFKFSLL